MLGDYLRVGRWHSRLDEIDEKDWGKIVITYYKMEYKFCHQLNTNILYCNRTTQILFQYDVLCTRFI